MPSSACKTCALDRKSTRLNSSHTIISYAVFCLKKINTPRCGRYPGLPTPPAEPPPPAAHAAGGRPGAVHGGGGPSWAVWVVEGGVFFLNETGPAEINTLPLPDPLSI